MNFALYIQRTKRQTTTTHTRCYSLAMLMYIYMLQKLMSRYNNNYYNCIVMDINMLDVLSLSIVVSIFSAGCGQNGPNGCHFFISKTAYLNKSIINLWLPLLHLGSHIVEYEIKRKQKWVAPSKNWINLYVQCNTIVLALISLLLHPGQMRLTWRWTFRNCILSPSIQCCNA